VTIAQDKEKAAARDLPPPEAPVEATPAREPEAFTPGEIRSDPEVREELARATPAGPAEGERRHRHLPAAAFYLLFAALLGGFLALERRDFFDGLSLDSTLRRVLLGVLASAVILGIYKIATALVLPRLANRASRYNVGRILRLAAACLIVFSLISSIFANWYTTAVSLGLLSLILGLALQAPITSFFGWVYVLVRRPYRVGDRIRIGDATGDVIEVGYLDTTLWEFGGELLSTDHPSGRLIRFPNSLVFNATVYNYSWALFPYVWNEIVVHVAYDSDLEFVAETMRAAVDEERGKSMAERVSTYRDLLARTPVDELEVAEHATVLFRVNPNTWIDAIVRYLVTPRRSGRIKTLLTRRILERLNAAPDRVLFPKSNLR
jgi:small-conductance mechanosensitive channel